MKNIFSILTIAGTFAVFTLQLQPDSAIVDQVEGYYIFTNSKPQAKYEFIAEIKSNQVQMATGTGNGLLVAELTYEQLRDNVIKLANKKHKGKGNGLIIHPEAGTASLISIK